MLIANLSPVTLTKLLLFWTLLVTFYFSVKHASFIAFMHNYFWTNYYSVIELMDAFPFVNNVIVYQGLKEVVQSLVIKYLLWM